MATKTAKKTEKRTTDSSLWWKFPQNEVHEAVFTAVRSMEAAQSDMFDRFVRLEVLYDQGLLNDPVSGFHHSYYSGGGISGQLNGPWNNSLVRFDVGLPIVSHGIHGVSASALILKLF